MEVSKPEGLYISHEAEPPRVSGGGGGGRVALKYIFLVLPSRDSYLQAWGPGKLWWRKTPQVILRAIRIVTRIILSTRSWSWPTERWFNNILVGSSSLQEGTWASLLWTHGWNCLPSCCSSSSLPLSCHYWFSAVEILCFYGEEPSLHILTRQPSCLRAQ